MLEWFRAFLENGLYAPHGYCLLWKPELLWTHALSDALIAAAYFSIPIALISFVRRRADLEFGFIFWLFALFIMACGATHIFSIWNLWNADYGYEAAVKALTAAASVLTAIMVWPLLPRALAIPSPSALQFANDELTSTLLARDAALEQLRAEMAERKRAEEKLLQTQKIEALGQLTGGIAHDFNNLLQAISSSIQLIERAPTDEERVSKWAGMAREATERAERLTAQLLTFSRVKAVSVEDVEVGEMLQSLNDLLARSLGPTIDLSIDAETDAVVAVDRTQLELALLNLVINARDAMPEGGAISVGSEMVAVQGDAELADGDYVALSVEDDGAGISPENLARVFDPFFSTKEAGKGTGLGLSMVHGLAKQQGGTVRIDSEVGVGTTVTILLPAATEAQAGNDARRTVIDTRDVDLSGQRILLVDDDEAVRAGIVEALLILGAEVEIAENGEAGLAALERKTFDLMLCDYAMPGMNGAELAAEARRAAPDLRIIMATGFADFAEIERALGTDAEVIRKPFSLGALAALLSRES